MSVFSCFFAGFSMKDSIIACPLSIMGYQIPS